MACLDGILIGQSCGHGAEWTARSAIEVCQKRSSIQEQIIAAHLHINCCLHLTTLNYLKVKVEY